MRTETKIFLLIFSVAAALLLFLYPRFGFETFTWAGNDARQYELIADNILAGNGFSFRTQDPYIPSPARMPGYPLVLAGSKLLFGGIVPVIILQILAHALSAILVYGVARRFLSKKFSIAAALLVGLHPYALFLSVSLMTETFFTLALIASLYVLLCYFDTRLVRYAAYSGILLGAATLFRPTTQMLPVAWVMLMAGEGLWRSGFLRKNLIAAGVFAVLFVAVLFPWMARNKMQFGRWDIVSANAYGYFVATPVQIIALKEGISRSEAREMLMADFYEVFKNELAPDAHYPDALAFDKFEYTDWFAQRNSAIIRENPGIFAKAVLIAVPEFLTKNDWLHPFEKYEILRPEVQPVRPLYRFWSEEGPVSAAKEIVLRFSCGTSCVLSFGLVALGRIFYFLVFVFSLFGIYAAFRKEEFRLPIAAIVLLVLYFAAAHLILTASAGHERYRLPMVPAMIVLALIGLRQCMATIRNKFFSIEN